MTAYEDAPFDAFHASPRPFLSLKQRVESEQQKNESKAVRIRSYLTG